MLRTEGLLEEGEEDGDDYAGFEAFAEADEEDCGGVSEVYDGECRDERRVCVKTRTADE